MKTPYEIFVSLRYLKTKKRYGTVSLNTFISIAGVVIGVATSIITLSVMTGFQGYFRDKIQNFPNGRSKMADIHGLHDEAADSDFGGILFRSLRAVTGDEDDGQIRPDLQKFLGQAHP